MVCSLCRTTKEIYRIVFDNLFKSYQRIRRAMWDELHNNDQDYRSLMRDAIHDTRFKLLCFMLTERQARSICFWIRDFFFEWHAIKPVELYDEIRDLFFPIHVNCRGEKDLREEKTKKELVTLVTASIEGCFHGIERRIHWLHEIALTRAGCLRQRWQHANKKQSKAIKKKMAFMPMPIIIEAMDESDDSEEEEFVTSACNCEECLRLFSDDDIF